jgi:N-glycosylase/DNA lyase
MRENGQYLAGTTELDLIKTFECGQCFRWNADESGEYTGVAFGHAATLFAENGKVFIDTDADAMPMWREYFDLEVDYEAIRLGFDAGNYLRECAEFGKGIRILRQEPWEALCSFIISQCNNIPRIKKIVETLCSGFGTPIEHRGKTLYTFPTAEVLASLEAEDLSPLRCGYRAPYIISAARAVTEGKIDLEALCGAEFNEAIAALKSLEGVGPKVANCAALFGLHQMSGFPIDVWMKRALKEHFAPDFDPKTLGEYAGLAQQYIFYYARSGDGANN